MIKQDLMDVWSILRNTLMKNNLIYKGYENCKMPMFLSVTINVIHPDLHSQ